MAFTVNFYTFSKKVNSTKRPSGDPIASFTCNIKEPSSVINPTIELSTSSNPTGWNYAKIAHFDNRYYFITDWVSDHGLWYAHMRVDALATWKTQLLATTQYVDRSASQSNSYIIDGKYAITSEAQITNVDISDNNGDKRPFLKEHANVTPDISYIFGITAGDGGSTGAAMPQKINGCAYYCMTPGKAEEFINYLLSDPTYLSLNADEISDSLAKVILNPCEFIGETYIVPCHLPVQTIQANMFVGWWPIDVNHAYESLPRTSGYRNYSIWTGEAQLPAHPQTSSYGIFVNASPYTYITAYCGIFGAIQIDPLMVMNHNRMLFSVLIDFKGQARLEIKFWEPDGNSGTWILWRRIFADTAVPIGMSQLSSGTKGASDAGQAASSIGNNFLSSLDQQARDKMPSQFGQLAGALGAVQAGVSGILSLASLQVPRASGKMAGASVTHLMDDFYIQCEHHLLTENAPNLKGEPLCEDKVLNTLNGFTQVLEPVIALPCTAGETAMIESAMSGGFFIES